MILRGVSLMTWLSFFAMLWLNVFMDSIIMDNIFMFIFLASFGTLSWMAIGGSEIQKQKSK